MRLILLYFVTLFTTVNGIIENPVDYVNILGGTNSKYDLSHGSTLPLIARPWGFNAWAPQTNDNNGNWWFSPYDRRFMGMRVTHQPSPWIGDYGHFLLRVSIPNKFNYEKSKELSQYSIKDTIYKPYYYKTLLPSYSTIHDDLYFEFTSTNHGAIMKVHYPKFVESNSDKGFLQTRRISLLLNGNNDTSNISNDLIEGVTTISGYTSANSGGVASNFAFYYVIGIYMGENGDVPCSLPYNSSSDNTWAFIDYLPTNNDFTIRIGTSMISIDQALTNLLNEVGVDKTFDDIKEEAKLEWNNLLSTVSIDKINSDYDSNELLTTFYSCLYRASLFPRQLTEVDSNGNLIHWSPYDGEIYSGELSTDSGFWDAFSTIYPLLSLINPSQLATTINGWLNAYNEGGWLPKWSSPANRGSMVGTLGDVSLADAIVKEIPNINYTLAYEAIRKDAFQVPTVDDNGLGRECLESYINNNYISAISSCDQIVSRTMNYWQSDFAISQAAKKLGYEDDYNILYNRSMNYNLLFDSENNFFRSKNHLTNRFVSNELFDEFAWGSEYTEGGPWQYRFYIPYDPKGLNELYENKLCEYLLHAQEIKPIYHIGSYQNIIHEETEMNENCWGQYSHNNQPSHYMLYMFIGSSNSYTDHCANLGYKYINKVLIDLYKSNENMYPGDEDNGQMSAWYILSSIGLYSLSPGTIDYILTKPLFDHITIQLPNQKQLIIKTINNKKENVIIKEIFWNEVLLKDTVSISYFDLMLGGTLTFVIGEK